MAINFNNKRDHNILCEGTNLLHDMKVRDFNSWRTKNLNTRLDISGQDLSGKNLSAVYLNGVSCVGTNLSYSNLGRANFMYANLQGSNITNSKTSETIFIKADLRDANLNGIDKNAVYLKYARLEGNDNDDYFI